MYACTRGNTRQTLVSYPYDSAVGLFGAAIREKWDCRNNFVARFAFLQAAPCRYVSDNLALSPTFPHAEQFQRDAVYTRGKCILYPRATQVRLFGRVTVSSYIFWQSHAQANDALTRGRSHRRETFRDDVLARINHSDKRHRCYRSYHSPNTVLISRSQIINQIVIIVIFKLPLVEHDARSRFLSTYCFARANLRHLV